MSAPCPAISADILLFALPAAPPAPRKGFAQGGKMAMREVSSCLGKTQVPRPAGRCSFTTGPNWGTARGGDVEEGAAGISCLSEHTRWSELRDLHAEQGGQTALA